jgi:hypothetical protein
VGGGALVIGYPGEAIRGRYPMDEIARGVAAAAVTLQSALLRSLVANGAMTPGQALGVIEKGPGGITRQGFVKGGPGRNVAHSPSAGWGPGGLGGCSTLTEWGITNGAEALLPWAGRCEMPA